MSTLAEAGKRCLVLVKENKEMDDSELKSLCFRDLRAGFKYLPGHLLKEIVNYYVEDKAKW